MLRHLLVSVLFLGSSSLSAGGIAESVGISGFSYTPSQVTIEVGESIDFAASGFHPLAFDASEVACTQNCNVTFASAGEYGFFCENHGGPAGVGMSGVVTVVESTIDDRVYAHAFELIHD